MLIYQIKNLTVSIDSQHGLLPIIKNFSLKVKEGEIVSVVAESGSGKSVIIHNILGLIEDNWQVYCDILKFKSHNLKSIDFNLKAQIFKKSILYVSSDFNEHFNEHRNMRSQLIEIIQRQEKSVKHANLLLIKALHKIGIKDHLVVLKMYPNQISKLMLQKILLSLALVVKFEFIVYDQNIESSSLNDFKEINQIIKKINQLQNSAFLILTSNLYFIRSVSHYINILYLGTLCESGPAGELLENSRHPYTMHLIKNSQKNSFANVDEFMKFQTPVLHQLPIGCRLGPRCRFAQKICINEPCVNKKNKILTICHFPL